MVLRGMCFSLENTKEDVKLENPPILIFILFHNYSGCSQVLPRVCSGKAAAAHVRRLNRK